MKKGLKISLVTIGALVGSLVICAGGYVGYIILSYSRIGDKELNINKMEEALKLLEGTHNFKGFASAQIDPRKDTVKTIFEIKLNVRGDFLEFVFTT